MRAVVIRLVACLLILRVFLLSTAPRIELPVIAQLIIPSQPEAPQPTPACILPDVVCADFTWQVADRFMTVWRSWGSTRSPVNYDPATFRQPFLLIFDACRSRGGTAPITSYSWTVQGVDSLGVSLHRMVATCLVGIPVPTEGAYQVSLTVRTQDGQAATIMQQVPLQDLLIVSLGDSYASGEGNPEVLLGPTSPGEWQDRRCHRSRFSGPAQAALELERRDRHSTVTFLSYACSGATIRQGLDGEYLGLVPQWPPLAPQIKAAATLLCGDDVCDRAEDPAIDVLLISVGGNDVGFSVAIIACAARLDDAANRAFRSILGIDLIPQKDCHRQPRLRQFLDNRLHELPSLYQELQQEIRTRLKANAALITEYPDDLFDSRAGCGTLEFVTATEAQWLAWYGQRLNQIIHDSWRPAWISAGNDRWRRDRRWDVVSDIAPAFAGYGYCAKPTYYGHLGQSLVHQLDYLGLLHPNAQGHRVYRDAILRKLQTAAVESIRFPPKRVTVTFEAVRVNRSTFPSPTEPLLVQFRVGGSVRAFGPIVLLNDWTPLPAGQYAFSFEVGHPGTRIDILVHAQLAARDEPSELRLELSLGREGNFGAGRSRQATSPPKGTPSLSVWYRVDVADLR